jgi:rhamnosyltransferase subunit B
MDRLHVLLPTLGSAGDVHPFIALGLELKRRGHRATLLTNPLFAALVERQGLGFLPVGSEADAHRVIANPDVWHLRKGFRVLAEFIVPAIAEIYRLIEAHAGKDTVVAFSTLALGARVAQEKLQVPSASVHLQPTVIRSHLEQGMFGNVRLSPSHPVWFKSGLFRLLDFWVLDRALQRPLNEFRARLGLKPVRRIMHRWLHSPQLVIGFFPEWFAPPQPDWPAHLHAVGFPLWDADDESSVHQARDFMRAGPAPVIFTPGSAGSTMQRFFAESMAAVRDLKLRALLVTNYPEQVPQDLPPGVRTFGYLPFSQILPEAALLVYHGGIGTLAQAIRAGIPQLVVPHGYDQFDSGWRIEQLRLGRSIPETQYRRRRASGVMRELLADAELAARCKRQALRVDARSAVARAADLLETLRSP